MDLEIPFNEENVYANYMRLNPQTKAFIERFNLDNRLFTEAETIYKKRS